MVRAIVKITAAPSNAQISLARKGTDTTCQGCGMFGHDGYTSGCGKCAQYILIKRFLERHPDQISPLISKYQKHQSERAKSRQSRPDRDKESFKENQKFKKTHRYPLRSNNKARVKKLQDAVLDILAGSDDEHSSIEETFVDALDTTSQSSSSQHE